MSDSIPKFLLIGLIILSLLACDGLSTPSSPPDDPGNAPSPPTTDTGWIPLQPGLERRTIQLYEKEQQVDSLYLLRLDPAFFRFDIGYQAEQPPTLSGWQQQTNALIVMNGGYFRREEEQSSAQNEDTGAEEQVQTQRRFVPTGLTIIKGQPMGLSYGEFAGMFAVREDSTASLRWLQQYPYHPEEPIWAALQSFPLLVKPGGQLGFPIQYEDGRRARRTVIAQDYQGRFILFASSRAYFTLHTLSVYLTQSDLNLNIALNLDGGASTGLLLASEPDRGISALSSLPIVILAYPR